ncbi:MAG: transporter substrate-binding domain-containing protein [Clostridia bacterium]|nr:transporter substrate-binding domain-containing protein [Clostridia bacterium]
MKQRILALTAALILFFLPGLAAEEITSLAQLSAPGAIVGVSQGSAAELTVKRELPQAQLVYYMDNSTAYLAVAQGKIDAYAYDRNQMRIALQTGVTGVHLLDETLGDAIRVAVGISPASHVPDLGAKINAFIREIKADGTQDDMFRRWVMDGNETMPEIGRPEHPALHLTVGTTGIVPPFSYYKGTELTGYDIEMAYRFAAWLGADVQFKVYDYGAIIPAAVAGDVDCIMANLNITEERQEALAFSDVLYEEQVGILVRGDAKPRTENAPAWQAYNGKRIGVLTGPLMEEIAHTYFPDSEYLLLNSYSDCIAALLSGKVDAYLGDEPGLKSVHAEQPRIDYIRDRITSQEYSFAFRKNDAKSATLCAELNAFLAACQQDGTLQELDDIWFGADEERKAVDMSGLTGTNGAIRVVTTSSDMPFSYIKDGKNVGYDIDLVVRFCRHAGYSLELEDVDFAARIPAIQSGRCDFTTDMNVTPERMEQVLFSDPTSAGGVVLGILSDSSQTVQASAGESALKLGDLNGKRIGVQTGSSFDAPVMASLPDAQISYFNTYPDMVAALKTQKIDGFPGDEPVLRMMAAEDGKLTILDERMDSFSFGFVLQKSGEGEKLRGEINDWLSGLRESGELERLIAKWITGPEEEKTLPDYAAFPAPNGTLTMATEAAYAPMCYYRGNEMVGIEIDLAARFCEARGYGLTVAGMNFDGVLPAVQSGKADFAAAGITITEERKESVYFSDPYYTGGTVMAVLKAEQPAATVLTAPEKEGFWEGIQTSFRKTFLRENRWRLFLEGIGNTMAITLLSILFGTVLGFMVFMLCRNGNVIANGVTRFCMWLVQGMPMVVLLMILYYIVFASVAVSGIAVAVIGFTLTFGAAVYGLLKMGVGTIDRGQYEAAYALGHSNRHTFYKIILPQAIPHVLPAYQGEIVGLIKATAIVGYIAVQDLTKMGDIVRSRTYEAFFPLIAVTVIYFVLEALLSFAVSRIQFRIDPKKRSRERILKGVNTYD